MGKKTWDHLGLFEGYDMRKMKCSLPYFLKVVQSKVLLLKKQIKGPNELLDSSSKNRLGDSMRPSKWQSQ